MRRLFWLLLPGLTLWGSQTITLEWLSSKPRSYAKDFYIWRYFDQNITPAQADEAFYQIKSVNWKLIDRYAEKTKKPGFAMVSRCRRLPASKLPADKAACSAVAISPWKFSKLSLEKKFAMIRQLSDYPDMVKWMDIMAEEHPHYDLFTADADTFFQVFNRCGSRWREKYLDHPLPPALLKRIVEKPAFSQTIKLIVTDAKLTRLQSSLLGVDAGKLSHKAAFFLALNALHHDHPALAKIYLARAYKTAWYRFDKDKVLFWQWMIDRKPETLTKLAESFDLNIYTLFAREKLGLPFPKIESLHFEKEKCSFDIQDPFAWLKLLQKIKKSDAAALPSLAKNFRCANTLGHYAFIMERAQKYRTHYFPTPYPEALEGLDADRKALILALARQESRFIPASLSPSYALGMMQIMPFLVKALAKERHEVFDLDAMFDPDVNVAYARTHLRYLTRYLYHPLFIAYAYNGGIGFTKRLLTKKGLFQKGKFEPWMSMEMVDYDESRRYGKKVLANYIVYKRILGEPVTVEEVVGTLTSPNRTDRFRSRSSNSSPKSAGK